MQFDPLNTLCVLDQLVLFRYILKLYTSEWYIDLDVLRIENVK
jgi:hypothetical protein